MCIFCILDGFISYGSVPSYLSEPRKLRKSKSEIGDADRPRWLGLYLSFGDIGGRVPVRSEDGGGKWSLNRDGTGWSRVLSKFVKARVEIRGITWFYIFLDRWTNSFKHPYHLCILNREYRLVTLKGLVVRKWNEWKWRVLRWMGTMDWRVGWLIKRLNK